MPTLTTLVDYDFVAIERTSTFPVHDVPGPFVPTPLISDWMQSAGQFLGYDLTTIGVSFTPAPDAAQRWDSILFRIGMSMTPVDGEMVAPWVEIAAEDAAAFDIILGEHWPSE
jgi:hypothetical protein